MTHAELARLIDAAFEGDVSEADFVRLEAELAIDPAARKLYYDRAVLTTLLEIEATSESETASRPNLPTTSRNSRRWRTAFVAMTAVCASLLLIVGWQTLGPSIAASRSSNEVTATSGGSQEEQSSGFAILSGEAAAVWAGDAFMSTGTIVPPGELELESGLAQFELFSGVTLVVEGAATFSIVSPMEVSVVRGKVRARVPEPAQGFRLSTPTGEVVDLGTEFAVDVTDVDSEVYVLDGEIEWHSPGVSPERLLEGDARRTLRSGESQPVAMSRNFAGTAELNAKMQDQQQTRRENWDAVSDDLGRDPRLIAHYRFASDHVVERRIPNSASAASVKAGEGAVVAAAPSVNRWGQSASALDFSPAGSRVRLQVPGEYQNLTLMTWVRINSLDRWYNSLFLTDGHELGEPHWQIMDDGRLFFSVKKNDVFDRSKGEMDKHVFYSPSFWNTSLSGRWLMIATVYDAAHGEVVHYLNGQVLSRETIPPEYLVTSIHIGDASLCNWGLPMRNQPHFAIRNLNGSMDEFLMFSSALTSDEIEELYEASRP